MRAAPAAARAQVTPELFMELRRPIGLDLAPDGSRIAFVVSPVWREKGKPIETRLWVDDAPATEDGAADLLPRFSPDGAKLAYSSDRGHAGRMSIWLQGGGEIGEIPGSVEDIIWSPDSSRLLVLAADLGSDRAGAQSATKIREAGEEEEDPRVLRPAQHWRRLYLVDAESGETHEVSPEGVNVFEVAWAGDRAAAVCTDDPSESAWYDAWIGLLDLDARTAERLHTAEWQLQSPAISPGGRVAWIEGFASDRALVTGTVNVHGVGPIAPELDVTWVRWDGDDSLWCAGWQWAGSTCGRLGLDGTYDELYAGEVVIGLRLQPSIVPTPDGGTVAAIFEGPEQPPEIVMLEEAGPRALTSLNAQLGAKLVAPEWSSYRWKSVDGLEIEGLLALPPERSNGALPLVVLVHGGPTATWAWEFAHFAGLPLLLTNEGYAVLLPNPRGSAGRGQEYARANLGDMGGADLKDILAGVDALVADGLVDDARVGITGGSYGGFMSSWAITQTDRFAAAIPMAVVTDWTSFHYTTNIGQFDALFLQGKPDDPDGPYPKWSPVFHAQNAKTPTMIMHGGDDLCTPLPQATEFYNALVEAGCEVELVIYPREGHGWTEREHQVDTWNRVRDFLAKHLS